MLMASVITNIILALGNGVLLYWALRRRRSRIPKVDEVLKLIQSFEADGHTLLEIRKINPQHVYLRSNRN